MLLIIKSNTILHFLYEIGIKEDNLASGDDSLAETRRGKWPLGALETMGEISLRLLLGTSCGLALSTVLCLPPDSRSRENHEMRMQTGEIWPGKPREEVPSRNPVRQVQHNRKSSPRLDMKLRPSLSPVMDYIVKTR